MRPVPGSRAALARPRRASACGPRHRAHQRDAATRTRRRVGTESRARPWRAPSSKAPMIPTPSTETRVWALTMMSTPPMIGAGVDHDLAGGEDRLPQVDVDAAHQRERVVVGADLPDALAVLAAHDGEAGRVSRRGAAAGPRRTATPAAAVGGAAGAGCRSTVIGTRSAYVLAANVASSRSSSSSRSRRPSPAASRSTSATLCRSASEMRMRVGIVPLQLTHAPRLNNASNGAGGPHRRRCWSLTRSRCLRRHRCR